MKIFERNTNIAGSRGLKAPGTTVYKRGVPKKTAADIAKNTIYALGAVLNSLFLNMFYRIEVEGLENVPMNGPVIFASNHSSFLDPMVLIHSIPRQFRSITGNWLFKIWWLAWAMWASDSIPAKGSIDETVSILENGGAVTIFPTGLCAFEKREMTIRAHKGVAVFALKAGAPVIPVGINGTLEAWPQTRILPRLFKKIKVRIGKPILHSKYPQEEIPVIIAKQSLNRIMLDIGKLMD